MCDFEFMAGWLFLAFLAVSLGALTFTRFDKEREIPLVVPSLTGFVLLTALRLSDLFNMKLMDLAFFHDHLLADSMAVGNTRDSGAMTSAERKAAQESLDRNGPAATAEFLFA